jgi:membrane protein
MEPNPGGGEKSSEVAKTSRRDRVHAWVRGRQQQLEAARATSTTVEFAFDALSYDSDTGAPVLAAALAFRIFLFQVPWACFLVILAGLVSDLTGRDITSLLHGKGGMTRLAVASVSSAAGLSGWAMFTALVLVAYAILLSARSLVKVLNIIHALVWGVPRTKLRSANRAALVFIGSVTALAAVSAGIALLRDVYSLGGLTLLVLYTALPLLVWWWVSWWFPHRSCPLIWLMPGAALLAIGSELLHVVTVVWFPHHIAGKSEVYGAIGVALAMLLWAYILGRIITLGIVLNAALWARFGGSAQALRARLPSWAHGGGGGFDRLIDLLFGREVQDESGPGP